MARDKKRQASSRKAMSSLAISVRKSHLLKKRQQSIGKTRKTKASFRYLLLLSAKRCKWSRWWKSVYMAKSLWEDLVLEKIAAVPIFKKLTQMRRKKVKRRFLKLSRTSKTASFWWQGILYQLLLCQALHSQSRRINFNLGQAVWHMAYREIKTDKAKTLQKTLSRSLPS